MKKLVLSMLLAATVGGSAAPVPGRYAPVNGLRMYYEIRGVANGSQSPLVLLHGGGSTIKRADWQVSMIESFLDVPMPGTR